MYAMPKTEMLEKEKWEKREEKKEVGTAIRNPRNEPGNSVELAGTDKFQESSKSETTLSEV
jgi:hypothetical protein